MFDIFLDDDILKLLITIDNKNYLLSFSYYYDDYERDYIRGILAPNHTTIVYEIPYPILDFYNGITLIDGGSIIINYDIFSCINIINKPPLFKNAFIGEGYIYYTTRSGNVYFLDSNNKVNKYLENIDNVSVLRKNTNSDMLIFKEYSKLYVPKKVFNLYNNSNEDLDDSNDKSYYIIYGSYNDVISTKDTLIIIENSGLYTIYSKYKFFIDYMYYKFPKLHNTNLCSNILYILDNNKIYTINTSNSILDQLPINMNDEIEDFKTYNFSVFYKTIKGDYYIYSRNRYNTFKDTGFFEDYDKDNYILKLNKEKLILCSKKFSF